MIKRAVIVETPFMGDVPKNVMYARACCRDCIVNHNEAPFLSHIIYTQRGILNDNNPPERNLGIEVGLYFGQFMKASVVYTNLGISGGMQRGMERAEKEGREIVVRKLDDDWEKVQKELIEGMPNHPFALHQVFM